MPTKVNDNRPYALEDLADELWRAETERQPIDPLTERYANLALADAYQIQLLNIRRRVAAGERIIGHKIGLTARAMQIKFNVDTPDYGHLLNTMRIPAGHNLNMNELIDPQIEVEPAFVLGRKLVGPGITQKDVLKAVEYSSVCFEVIDSRILDWRIRLQDTVADNGSSARIAVGTQMHDPTALDLADLKTELEVDGQIVETGSTRDILGHPINGVVWLVNAIAQYGVAFEAGHVILPGTCTRSYRIRDCHNVTGRIEGLGEVTMNLTGTPWSSNSDAKGESIDETRSNV